MKVEIFEVLKSLKNWDFIVVTWLDSSRDRRKAKMIPGVSHDTLVVSPGFYLGVGGRIEQHLILGRDAVITDDIIKYDNIILKNITKIEVISRYSNPFGQEKESLMFVKSEKRRKMKIW